jgi:type IV secretion system protein VirB2
MKSLSNNQSKQIISVSNLMLVVFAMMFSSLAMAAGGGDFSETSTTLTKFMTNVQGILTAISIAVVTIAIIFCGYQIAFANKRIADVAPIMVGAVLIGAAAQIAKMLIG